MIRLPVVCATVALLAVALGASAQTAAQDAAAIVGTWRGTSVCVDLVAHPACHDEFVVYEVTGPAADGTVRLQADKIVEGKREAMGELSFAFARDTGTWIADFERPRMRGRWSLRIDGTTMAGTLASLPDGKVARRVSLKKQ
jgi:hypothetical protein